MLGHQRHDDARVFRPLALVDRDGVGQHEVLEFGKWIQDRTAVENHRHALGPGGRHAPDVAVEDFLVVVVADLHHLVARAPAADASRCVLPGRVEGALQHRVELLGAHLAPVHGGDDLDVFHGIEAEAPGNAFGHERQDGFRNDPGVAFFDEVEIVFIRSRLAQRHLSGIDAVGVDDDAAALGLAEDFVQDHHRYQARGDDIRQHAPRAHRRQLVHVAHQHQGGARGQGPDEVVHQDGVDHRGFVHHQQVGFQRVLGIALEAPLPGTELQQAVYRARLGPGAFGQALGGSACGGGQADPVPETLVNVQDRPDDGGFARSRTAGDHQHAAGESATHRFALAVGQLEAQLALCAVHGPARIRTGETRGGR